LTSFIGGKMGIFDEAAKTWDLKPERIDTAKRVGEAILSQSFYGG